jgi:hypothetical protein
MTRTKYQILQGAYAAALYVSDGKPRVYHAIITEQNSPNIISWVQCNTAEDCEREAIETLAYLNGEHGSKLLLFPPITTKGLRRLGKKRKAKAARKSG